MSDLLFAMKKNPPPSLGQGDKVAGVDTSITRLEALMNSEVSVSEEEVEAYREAAYAQLTEENFSDLFANCRKETIKAITVPLGLGNFVALYDKVGGNVDTIFNVRKGIWATTEEKEKFENREAYDSKKYHSGNKAYREYRKKLKQLAAQGKLKNAYTGETIEQFEQDHIRPAHKIANDPGRVLAEVDGAELANIPDNLVATDKTVNVKKSDYTVTEFLKELSDMKKDKIKKIKELKSKKTLSERDKKNLETHKRILKRLEAIDKELLEKEDKRVEHVIEDKLRRKYYRSEKFIRNTAVTSLNEGYKMGKQQAFGLLLVDLSNAFFDELIDCWKNGIASASSDEKLSEALKIRLTRVGNKVLADWKNVIAAFRDGFFSGILSNLLTVYINTFRTTWENFIRVIREGMFILVRAGKTLLFPDKGCSKEEVWDAVLKILVAGIITVGGVALEDLIMKTLEPLKFYGKDMITLLSRISVGVLMGVSTAIVLYGIDKWDPFGAKDIKRRRLLEEQIERDAERLQAEHEKYLTEMEQILGIA